VSKKTAHTPTPRETEILGKLALEYLLSGTLALATGREYPMDECRGLKSKGLVKLRKQGKGHVVEISAKGWPYGHAQVKARWAEHS